MFKLYNYPLSTDCYKVRLLASLLSVPYETVAVDYYPGREHESEWFRSINPLGTLPVIRDGVTVIREAQGILAYLASRYDRTMLWYPTADAGLVGKIGEWMAFAHSLSASTGAARLGCGFFQQVDLDRCRADGHRLLRVLDEHLWFNERQGLDWLCAATHPTIADIACFPDVMLSEEGGISREDYPAVRRWCDRIRRVDGFVAMPGIFAGRQAEAGL